MKGVNNYTDVIHIPVFYIQIVGSSRVFQIPNLNLNISSKWINFVRVSVGNILDICFSLFFTNLICDKLINSSITPSFAGSPRTSSASSFVVGGSLGDGELSDHHFHRPQLCSWLLGQFLSVFH